MSKHCCEDMVRNSTLDCDIHTDKYDCPDVLIHYSEKFDEYGLIVHDGGTASIHMNYCPFCGFKLPESKREQWFDELEALGYDDPWDQDIPEEYESDKWYKNK